VAVVARVLMTVPDRLARHDVPPVRLIEARAQRGCPVELLARPMRQDPYDQLLLQRRGAVAESARTRIADRRRRGRQAQWRRGPRLPWRVPPDGAVMDPECPRDPQPLRRDPVQAAVITHLCAWSTDPQTPATRDRVATRLTDDHLPPPRGGPRGHVASVRGSRRSPVYTGTAYSERTRPVPARIRQSAVRPVGLGHSHRPAPPDEWMAIPVPAILNQETFAAAQALDALVGQDLCRILRAPALMTHALARAHGGAWLPQALQARRKTLREALTQLERQQTRGLEVYLAEIIGRDACERTRQEVTPTPQGLSQPLRQLEAQQPVDTAALAQGLEAFCRRLQPTLDQLTCAQRRPLVERLIDHVIVTHDQVEIRSVVPTGPTGETTPFCHVRLDDLSLVPRDKGLCNKELFRTVCFCSNAPAGPCCGELWRSCHDADTES
jgi:Resolvase, N terminal domain/Recombinase